MRNLNIDELEQVYGAGGSSKSGYGSSPTPPCGGSKSKASKGKASKIKKAKKSKSNARGSKGYC